MQLVYCDHCDDHFPSEEFEEIHPGEFFHFPYDTGQVGHIAEVD